MEQQGCFTAFHVGLLSLLLLGHVSVWALAWLYMANKQYFLSNFPCILTVTSICVDIILQQGSSQGCPDYICQICGDDIDILQEENEYFVACNDCAFPVCRTCYEYERQEGTQVCPRCKTRYKRHKGTTFVP